MIWESGPWKLQLSGCADQVERWRHQNEWTETDLFNIEKEIFFAFYAIRKLLDAQTKLSFECRDTQTQIFRHRAREKTADLMNWHNVDEMYDLEKSKQAQISLRDLCNSIIHSFVFVILAGDQGFQGILFNTDRDKNEQLLLLKANNLQKVLLRVANDQVVSLNMVRQEDGEFKVVMASSKQRRTWAMRQQF